MLVLFHFFLNIWVSEPKLPSQDQNSKISINLNEDISLTWDNNSYFIVEDTAWISLNQNFENKLTSLVELISDTRKTQLNACSAGRSLVVGDVAFLALLKYYGADFPLVQILKSQCDYFHENCNYPVGFFDILEEERKNIEKRTKEYLKL